MKIIKNKNVDELMQITADLIINQIEELSKKQEKIVIGLVGGRSVAKLYYELGKHNSSCWKKCHFFMIDERYVPLDDPQSNYKLVKETLLDTLLVKDLINDEFIHSIRTDLKGPQAALEYSKEFKLYAQQLDIAILGTGEDGHIAGIFPEKIYSNNLVYEYFENSPKLPLKRISITPNKLSLTKTAYTLFIGEEKNKALKNYVDVQSKRTLPQQVLDKIKNNTIITDQVDVK